MCGFHRCIILFYFLIFFRILYRLGPHCLYLFNCKSFSIRESCMDWTHVLFYFLFSIFFTCCVGCFISVWVWPMFFSWAPLPTHPSWRVFL